MGFSVLVYMYLHTGFIFSYMCVYMCYMYWYKTWWVQNHWGGPQSRRLVVYSKALGQHSGRPVPLLRNWPPRLLPKCFLLWKSPVLCLASKVRMMLRPGCPIGHRCAKHGFPLRYSSLFAGRLNRNMDPHSCENGWRGESVVSVVGLFGFTPRRDYVFGYSAVS